MRTEDFWKGSKPQEEEGEEQNRRSLKRLSSIKCAQNISGMQRQPGQRHKRPGSPD